jgi:hypothetical protein
MIRRLSLLFFCAGLLVAKASPANPALPLRAGEKLTYRVAWAIVPGAGEIKIDAALDRSGAEPRLVVTSTTATRRLAKMLLPFEARAESLYDPQTGRLLKLHETATQRRKKTDRTITFDYARREALYAAADEPEPRRLPIHEGNPSDLIMALLQTRSWNLQPGQARDALVIFDDDFYELTIHALRYEDVQTPLGKFRTLVLEPRMDKTEPKGMFRKGASVHVWIAQNELNVPVKFEVEFKIGTGTATLESYTPPTDASPAAAP